MTKKDLEKIIEKRLKIKSQINGERRKEQLEWEIKNQEYGRFEKMHLAEKQEIYHFINKWGETFSKSATFQKLLELKPFQKDNIEIFGSGWAHKLPRHDGYGCWSFVTLNENGFLEYNAGYKWMGVSESFSIDEESIERLNLQYLRDLYDSIKSKKVYEYIGNCIKNTSSLLDRIRRRIKER